MPKDGPKGLAEQLAETMERAGVSQRELARRLAAQVVDDPASKAFERRWDSKRRWVKKVLMGEVVAPTQESLVMLAVALDVGEHHFKVVRQRRRVATPSSEIADLQARLATLEEQALRLEDLPSAQEPLREAIRRLASGDTEAALRALSEAADQKQ